MVQPACVICATNMDLFGQMLLFLAALVASSHCIPAEEKTQPEELKVLPDASVFEMKPPKEFLDLFKPDESKHLFNPLKSPLSIALANANLEDISKYLPDPKIFEMKPPKEFLDLFQPKDKEPQREVKNKENLVTAKSLDVGATSAPEAVADDKKPSAELEAKKEDVSKEEAQLVKPKEENNSEPKLPDKIALPDASVFEMKPPKEFLIFQHKDTKESSNSVVQHQSSNNDSKDDKRIVLNQNVFESKPPEWMNMYHFNDKEIDFNKPIKWPSWYFNVNNFEEQMKFPDWFRLPEPVIESPKVLNEKDAKTNENSYADTNSKDDIEVQPEQTPVITEFKDQVSLDHKPDAIPLPPKLPNNSVYVPVKLIPAPQNPNYGYGNMASFMSSHYPSQNPGFSMFNLPLPSQSYGYLYTNQPNVYLSSKNPGLPMKKETDNISPSNEKPSNKPVNYPTGNAGQNNNYQNQAPFYVNVPYGAYNDVPGSYVGPLNNPYYQGQSAQPSFAGYNQNNLYALVPITNGYNNNNDYKPYPYISNYVPPTSGNGMGTGRVNNLVPVQVANGLLSMKDFED